MNKASVIGIGLVAAFCATAQQIPSATNPAAPAVQSGAAPRISIDDFSAFPFMANLQLSPNGKHVATAASIAGLELVAILELGAPTTITHRIPLPENYDLMWYRWAGNSRLLISAGQVTRFDGEAVYTTRLVMYDLTTSKSIFIGKKYQGLDGDTVIHVDRDGQSLLLNIQEKIYEYPSVWRVDLNTMKMEEIVKQQNDVWNWFADSSGVVRAGLGSADKRRWLLYRQNASEKFRKVVDRKVTKDDEEADLEKFIPIDGSDAGYAVADKNTGRYGLYHYDFASGALGDAIYEHPSVDIDGFSQSENGEIEAVYYTDDRSRVEWLNPKMKQMQAHIDAALPNRINRVVSSSRDNEIKVVWTGSSSDPGRYYLYQVATGTLSLLSTPYDKIGDKRLALMESVSYRARDGLDIPAYLTLPHGLAAKALPLVVMPHGGPFMRNVWGYDTFVQFLANRGYAVLQPNFRGSTGYGKAFVEKGIGQWGRAMQDDLDDGVRWLVNQGKVDAKRVCIMGWSYGGYAAMLASVRSPEIYRCAISFAGISDVRAMLSYDQRRFSAPRYFRNWRKRLQDEKKFYLSTVSPLRTANRITVPLLIAHGEKDDIVPVSQSIRLHETLLKANKSHEYVIYAGERHGFRKPENLRDFLQRVEAFLNKYNPAE